MKNEIKSLATEIAFDYSRDLDKDFIRRIELGIIGYRATIIRQDYNKSGKFASSIEEGFCVPMEQVKETDCCGNGDATCYIWRSEFKIPDPVRTKDGSNFNFVGNTNGSDAYTFIQAEEYVQIKKGTRFAKYLKYYTFYNGYIYTFNTGNNGKTRIRYVPDNPEELLELKSCDGIPCITEITLSEDMKKIIKDWVREELSGKPLSNKKDIEIDANNKS